ncbi:MAG: hypothetical protein Q8N00_17315 [Nitrospirota bacterium]|nr:hypothetical protein [Nitrospirota bacterium]
MHDSIRLPSSPKTQLSRRDVLRQARSLGIAAASLPWLLTQWSSSALAAVAIKELTVPAILPQPASPLGGPPQDLLFQSPLIYGLRLGSGPYVEVFGVQGGEPVAQFSAGAILPDGSLPKSLSSYQYQDIILYYLPVPGAAMNAWLVDSMKGTAPPVNGSLYFRDRSLGSTLVGEMSFTNALVREIKFPEADQELGYQPAPFRITLAVQQTQRDAAGNPNQPITQVSMTNAPVKGLFSMSIQAIGSPVSDVVRVESLELVSSLIPAVKGRGYQGTLPRALSTVRLQLPESKAALFYAWHAEFVLKGQNGNDLERTGELRWFLPTNPSTTLFSMQLQHLGILSVTRLPTNPRYVQVEMYCEKVEPFFA